MIALISDIHGNLQALQAVIERIDQLDAAPRIWCLGDITGYGARPGECVDLVRARCEVALVGNHDLAVVHDKRVLANREQVAGMFEGGPGAGIAYAQQVLDESQVAWLRSLQPHCVLDNVELQHGSTRDPIWEYVRTAESATTHLMAQQRELGAVGHTHMPLLWELAAGATEATGGLMPDGSSLVLHRGTKRVFNPGSVGQPRDRDPRAAFATLASGTLAFHRVEYDIVQARADIAAAGLPAESSERLELGW